MGSKVDFMGTPTERFWRKVDKRGPDDCWEWLATQNALGDGLLKVGGKYVLAHRFALEQEGDIVDDFVVRHSCDNPSCVNPAHLSIGTHADNRADCVRQGRQAKGTGNGRAKLNEQKVREIRGLHNGGQTKAELSRRYGVDPKVIAKVITRENWGHVQ